MAPLSELTAASVKRPGERVIHVTNHSSATALQKRAAFDQACNQRIILNAKELSREINERRYDKWVAEPLARVGGVARAVASAPTVKVGDAVFGMGGLASVVKQGATATTSAEAIFVFENSIDSEGFGKLLSYYSTAEPSKMPTIVVAANNEMKQLQDKLIRYSESFTFHEVYGSNSSFWDAQNKPAPMSLVDIVQGLIQNNTLAVANSEFSLDGILSTDIEELTQNLAAAYAVIRSVNFESNKFASSGLTAKALTLLDDVEITRLDRSKKEAISALRVLFILWDLYLNENKTERLDEAIELSLSLGSDLLKAHCQRLINLSAGYSEFSRHSLEEAEMVFRRSNQDPMAIYCRNNALLNVMHQGGHTTDQFSELLDEAAEKCPNMSSMVRLLNNAGVGALLDSRYEKALEFFEKSKNYNALPIHRFGLDVNVLLSRFMSGENISADDFDRLVSRVERANVDRRYGYHQSIILINVLTMQEELGHSSALTRKLLKARSFMSYQKVLNGECSVANFFEKRLPTTTPQERYKGQRGDFILRTNLIPIIHFGWS